MNPQYFDLLLKTITKNQNAMDIPVASLIINQAGEVVSLGWNTNHTAWDIAAHAEINAINKLTKKLKTLNLEDYKLLTTLEPCTMCYTAIKQAKINHVEYIVDSSKFGVTNHLAINDLDLKILKNSTPQQETKCQEILTHFFKKLRE